MTEDQYLIKYKEIRPGQATPTYYLTKDPEDDESLFLTEWRPHHVKFSLNEATHLVSEFCQANKKTGVGGFLTTKIKKCGSKEYKFSYGHQSLIYTIQKCH